MSAPAPAPAPASATAATLSLLTLAHPPTLAANIHATKLHRKPLYLHATDARSARQSARSAPTTTRPPTRRPKPLSAREKRRLRIHAPPRSAPYETFLPLHALWGAYMREVLGPQCAGQGQAQLGARLAGADYHGALLEVVRSRCPSRVGVRGVCVKETRGMFYLATEAGVVKEMPKEHTVFRFEVPLSGEAGDAAPTTTAPAPATAGAGASTTAPTTATVGPATATAGPAKPRCMVFELHGQQFMYRAAERVGRKFKNKAMADL